jgi:hypothetical protein
MATQAHSEDSPPELPPAGSGPGPGGDSEPAAAPATAPSQLNADEQMALYEEQLKEDDWGHQPC